MCATLPPTRSAPSWPSERGEAMMPSILVAEDEPAIQELLRVKAVLRRRAPQAAQEILTVGSRKLDPGTHRVTANGAPVQLGPTEYRLLKFLLARPERVHSRRQLLDQVWGDHVYIEERTIDVHIRRLRLNLQPFDCARMIETVRGGGYRLAARQMSAGADARP